MKKLVLVFVLHVGPVLNVQAASLQNDEALANVTNTNVIFDISPGGKRLLGQLNVIYKTYEQLVGFGHKPHFVLAFRGGATKFVTIEDKYVSSDDLAIKKRIQRKIQDFKELGATNNI